MERHALLVPEHLEIRMKQMGLSEEFILWQHATDWLRAKYHTHLWVFPCGERFEDAKHVFSYDYVLMTPYGEEFENETIYSSYYEAMEAAVEEALDCIQEDFGHPEEVGYKASRIEAARAYTDKRLPEEDSTI